MATVRLASITKHYGSTVAVDALDLEVADGEMVTLSGRRAAARRQRCG
jgi:ABC-type sugar transport system ATPase subunit